MQRVEDAVKIGWKRKYHICYLEGKYTRRIWWFRCGSNNIGKFFLREGWLDVGQFVDNIFFLIIDCGLWLVPCFWMLKKKKRKNLGPSLCFHCAAYSINEPPWSRYVKRQYDLFPSFWKSEGSVWVKSFSPFGLLPITGYQHFFFLFDTNVLSLLEFLS